MALQSRFWIVILISYLIGCTSIPSLDKADVKSFDDKYQQVISGIRDSLFDHFGGDTSFLVEFRRSWDGTQLSYYDTSGNFKGNGKFNYSFTDQQKQFIDDQALAGNIQFDKKLKTFYTKLFAFKNGEKIIWLVIAPDSNSTKGMKFDELVYSSDDRFYFWGDAWH